jgi:type I restriction enzyme S subunit
LRLTTGTTGRKKLTKNALMNAPIKVCSLGDQNKIVQEIESRLSVTDKMEESITQSLLQAEALRQSILKKAFEGKLI